MRVGGLTMILGRAIDRVPSAQRYRAAIVLGALREDVAHVRGLPRPVEHWSLSHFWRPGGGGYLRWWPGARATAVRRFVRAVGRHRAGEHARAYVELGRAAHLLVDMACPVHVHRAFHDTDGYEWYVDGNAEDLANLPEHAIPALPSTAAIIDALATITRRFPADRLQHPLGRWMIRRGLARSLPQEVHRDAAHAIVPAAIAHAAALIARFEATTRA